jgi:hypothetical protein
MQLRLHCYSTIYNTTSSQPITLLMALLLRCRRRFPSANYALKGSYMNNIFVAHKRSFRQQQAMWNTWWICWYYKCHHKINCLYCQSKSNNAYPRYRFTPTRQVSGKDFWNPSRFGNCPFSRVWNKNSFGCKTFPGRDRQLSSTVRASETSKFLLKHVTGAKSKEWIISNVIYHIHNRIELHNFISLKD